MMHDNYLGLGNGLWHVDYSASHYSYSIICVKIQTERIN